MVVAYLHTYTHACVICSLQQSEYYRHVHTCTCNTAESDVAYMYCRLSFSSVLPVVEKGDSMDLTSVNRVVKIDQPLNNNSIFEVSYGLASDTNFCSSQSGTKVTCNG